MPPFTCINVNFPKADKFKGAHLPRGTQPLATRTGTPKASYGADYFWLVGDCEGLEPEATDTDRWALLFGYVTIRRPASAATDYSFGMFEADFLKQIHKA